MSYPMILRTIKIRDVIKNKIAKKFKAKKLSLNSRAVLFKSYLSLSNLKLCFQVILVDPAEEMIVFRPSKVSLHPYWARLLLYLFHCFVKLYL